MNIKVNFLLSAKHHNTERNQEKQSKKKSKFVYKC